MSARQASLMRIPAVSFAPVRSGVLQRCACGKVAGPNGECEECKKKRESGPTLERKRSRRASFAKATEAGDAALYPEAPPIVHDVLRSPGAPLEPAARSVFEHRFGSTLADVRVHADDQARASARAVGAAAYTVGSHIAVARPEYAGSDSGLLAHELTHVIQQQGKKANGPIPIGAPDHPAEHEAERSAQVPMAQRFAPVVTVSPMLQRDLFPFFVAVGERRRVNSRTAHPESGISVTWTGDNIVLQANLQVYGPAASPTVANEMKKTIEKYWNVTSSGNGHSYRISCTVNITHRAENAGADGNAIQVMVVRQGATAASATQIPFFGARTMVFNLDRGTDWTPAHEFGHLLGLGEHYRLTATGSSNIDPGWEGNIMADRASGSAVDYRNAEELLNLYAYENKMLPPRPEETMA